MHYYQLVIGLGILAVLFLVGAMLVAVTKVVPVKKRLLTHRVLAGIGFLVLLFHVFFALRPYF